MFVNDVQFLLTKRKDESKITLNFIEAMIKKSKFRLPFEERETLGCEVS